MDAWSVPPRATSLWSRQYRCADRVDDETSAPLVVLPGIGDHNRHVRVLIEHLLDAAVVNTLPGVLLTRGAIVGLFGITEILGMGNVVRRVYIGVATRRRSGILFVDCYRRSEEASQQAGVGAYERRGRPNATSRTCGPHVGQMPHRGYYLRRST